jgi:hypothetical protein
VFGDLVFCYLLCYFLFCFYNVFVNPKVINIFVRLRCFGRGFLFVGNLSECEVLLCWYVDFSVKSNWQCCFVDDNCLDD